MEVGDTKCTCIPVIDMQKLEDNNDGDQQQQQYKKLREASEEWGCFRIMNHKISLTLMSEMKKVVRELLDLPIDIKKRNTEVIPNSCYVAPTEFSRFFEGLGIYDFGSPHSVDVFCSHLDIPPHREIICSSRVRSDVVLLVIWTNKKQPCIEEKLSQQHICCNYTTAF